MRWVLGPRVPNVRSEARAKKPPRSPWILARGFRGVEELRRQLVGGAPLPSSTTSGRLDGWLCVVDLGAFTFTVGALQGAAHCKGVCPPALVSVTLVLDAPGGGTINGAPLVAGSVLLYPPAGLYEGWTPAGYRWVSAFLPRAEIEPLVRTAGGRLPTLPGTRALRATLPWSDREPLETLLGRLEPARARATPEPLDGALARSLTLCWRGLVARAWRHGVPVRARRPQTRGDRALRAADRYLRKHLAEPVYLGELCRSVRVSERTLEHMFRRRIGIAPIAYLNWLRLNEARRLLQGRTRDAVRTVTEVASAVGFSHLGRFAAAYRNTFGEAPRETLRGME